ncbi:methyltransferase domain-containing protein [Planosporangium thailandense]|uniref:Methyltransferase domain-containing protein n=1 Tax=Planosporangium thailandense TaxID=765197 RepID=A0ABX0XXX6_9ACTN|nr:methyltransferase domain-containing protein [Planosporangium thailandense]
MSWDPEQYARFAAERARPFHDLIAQIPTTAPETVVDLGCGPGTVTVSLADRWPDARVYGLDSSPDMIAAAARLARPGRLEFGLGDIAGWRPAPDSVDVIVSNAALQWVPGHLDALPGWAAALRPGGTLALQVPLPRGVAATDVFRSVATSSRWAARLGPVASGTGPRGVSPVQPATAYLDVLAGHRLAVDAWETTYLHVLPGPDPVYEWFAGTGLRPYLDALADDPPALERFRAEVAQRLREEYPQRGYGTVLPFPRLFVVASRNP